MKKILRKYRSLAILFILSSAFIPNIVDARDIDIKSVTGNPVIIDQVIGVMPDDTLRIYKGTKIEIREGGGFYIRGNIFIGLDDEDSVQNTSIFSKSPDINKTITITSSSTLPFLDIDGGNAIGIDIDFKGTVFAVGYRGASLAISSSTLFDTTAGIIPAHQPFIAMYSDSTLDLSYSSIISNVDPNNTESTQPRVGYENAIGYGGYPLKEYLIEVYSTSHATFTAMRVYSQISAKVFGVYGNSSIDFRRSHILSCEPWIILFNTSQANGELNNPVCKENPYIIFNEGINNIKHSDTECCSSVLFIPGLQGSRLYRKQVFENRLWEPNRDADVSRLFLDGSGNSILGDIYAKDILDKVEISGVGIAGLSYYRSFINFLDSLRTENISLEHRVYPYDWRFMPDKIVDQKLMSTLDDLAHKSHNGKVTIIAHSYGGLVTKELLNRIKESRKNYLIDKVILVAVPETGAPLALFSALHGENQEIMLGLIHKASTAMALAINMPAAYLLMPSEKFFENITISMYVPKKSLTFAYDIIKPVSMFNVISWIKQITGRPQGLDLTMGSILVQKTSNLLLEANAMNYMSKLHSLNQTLNSNYRIWSLAGIGIQTLSGMKYEYSGCEGSDCKKPGTLKSKPAYNSEGDGTVILDSMQNRIGKVLKIDLAKINQLKLMNTSHANILESEDVQIAIKNILVSGSPVEDNGSIYVTDRKSSSENLYTTTVQGDIVGGITYMRGAEKFETIIFKEQELYKTIEQIPNSNILKFGDTINFSSQVKPDTISFKSNKSQRVDLVYSYTYNSPTANWNSPAQTYKSIAVTSNSVIELNEASSTLSIDIDGDGDIEKVIESIGEPVDVISTSTASSTQVIGSSTQQFIRNIPKLISDLSYYINSIDEQLLEINKLKNNSLKVSYRKKLNKTKATLVTSKSNLIKFFGADGLIVHSLEAQIIDKELNKIYSELSLNIKDINRLLELESFYSSQISSINAYILSRGTRGVNQSTLAKKINAERYISDIGILYIAFSEVEDVGLEFLGNHGTIFLERLQRP